MTVAAETVPGAVLAATNCLIDYLFECGGLVHGKSDAHDAAIFNAERKIS